MLKDYVCYSCSTKCNRIPYWDETVDRPLDMQKANSKSSSQTISYTLKKNKKLQGF